MSATPARPPKSSPLSLSLLRALACLFLLLGGAVARAGTQVALVIGNQAYADAPLANPVNDARAVGRALRKLGFTVVELSDGTRAQMEESIARVRELLAGQQGVGLFYYAGHALQLDWRNYLVPVDARLRAPRDVGAQAVDVQSVLEAFRAAGNRMNVVVLDACRDNPFGSTGRALGLAQMDAPPGSFLAYSTAPGNVAEDGSAAGGHSLYTQSLLQELARPQARIEDVFKRVRLQVRQRTQGRQIPWESTSLEDEYRFDTGLQPAHEADDAARQAAFAREMADWDRIARSGNVNDYYEFLRRYPNGNVSELAQWKIEELQAAKIEPQLERQGGVARPWHELFRSGDRYEFQVRDGLTGLAQQRVSTVVQVAADGQVVLPDMGRNGVAVHLLPGGFVRQDGGGSYDPPWPRVPGGRPFQVGKAATTRTTRTAPDGSRSWAEFSSRVVGRETVTVPMGTLDTYKVVVDAMHQSGRRVRLTYWYDPNVAMPVKSVRESRLRNAALDISVSEMVSRTPAP